MPELRIYAQADLAPLIAVREGETKLGERIGLAVSLQEGLRSSAPFVILGLPEDIGVRANGGIGGAATAWPAFLKSFLNIQETAVLSGQDFLLLGALDFTGWMQECMHAEGPALRDMTSRIDEAVYPLIREIVGAGKIPLVIGGGHNNAYPLLKGASLALRKPLHAVNLDAHSDFRRREGRHSGNGFRYAYEDGFLKKYALLGLHEAYNGAAIVAELKGNPDLLPLFWDDIFMRKRISWEKALAAALDFVGEDSFGTELDADCIERALSSAATPAGIAVQAALDYLYQCGRSHRSIYLHLPEGVAERSDGQQDIFTGKLLSYLVQAFAKGVKERS